MCGKIRIIDCWTNIRRYGSMITINKRLGNIQHLNCETRKTCARARLTFHVLRFRRTMGWCKTRAFLRSSAAMDRHAIERATELLREARRVVALTGAGISRPSGIPDFRSAGGLWTHDDPMAVASLAGFRADPRRFYTWVRPLIDTIEVAVPNPAHLALAQLEREGRLTAVITQNIDGLHQRAGSHEIYELHGHIRSATCL